MSGWAGSMWRSCTRRGIHLLFLIMSQLAGDPDIASSVRDILSMSVHPSRDIRELAASVTRHVSPRHVSDTCLVSTSPWTLCTLLVKLMTLAVSSPAAATLEAVLP